MTLDIGLHVVGVRTAGVRTLRHNQISRMDSLRNFLTHSAPLRTLRARELRYYYYSLLTTIRAC